MITLNNLIELNSLSIHTVMDFNLTGEKIRELFNYLGADR